MLTDIAFSQMVPEEFTLYFGGAVGLNAKLRKILIEVI
jgi:hypothetical protein